MAAWEGDVNCPSRCAARDGRIGFGKRAAVDRDVAIGVPHPRAQMAAMELGQLQAGHLPQPQIERDGRVLHEFVKLAGDFQIRILENVRFIQATLQTTA